MAIPALNPADSSPSPSKKIPNPLEMRTNSAARAAFSSRPESSHRISVEKGLFPFGPLLAPFDAGPSLAKSLFPEDIRPPTSTEKPLLAASRPSPTSPPFEKRLARSAPLIEAPCALPVTTPQHEATAEAAPVPAGSPPRMPSSRPAAPPELLKKRSPPTTYPAVVKAHRILEAGFFNIVCVDKTEHPIRFIEAARGDFNAFCSIAPNQPQILERTPNSSLGVKIFHPGMRHFDHAMQQRIVELHAALQAVGILCPQLHNAKEFIEGCGYLLVEYVPLPAGDIAPEELLAIAELAYENALFIDLKSDNFQRTSTGALSLVDWGGEMFDDASDLKAHFRKLIRNLNLEDLARDSAQLSSLLPGLRTK